MSKQEAALFKVFIEIVSSIILGCIFIVVFVVAVCMLEGALGQRYLCVESLLTLIG